MVERIYENTKEIVLINNEMELVKKIDVTEHESIQEKFTTETSTILYSKFEDVHEVAFSDDIRIMFYIFEDNRIDIKRIGLDGRAFLEAIKCTFEFYSKAIKNINYMYLRVDNKANKIIDMMNKFYSTYFDIEPQKLEMWSNCVKARYDIL